MITKLAGHATTERIGRFSQTPNWISLVYISDCQAAERTKIRLTSAFLIC